MLDNRSSYLRACWIFISVQQYEILQGTGRYGIYNDMMYNDYRTTKSDLPIDHFFAQVRHDLLTQGFAYITVSSRSM